MNEICAEIEMKCEEGIYEEEIYEEIENCHEIYEEIKICGEMVTEIVEEIEIDAGNSVVVFVLTMLSRELIMTFDLNQQKVVFSVMF